MAKAIEKIKQAIIYEPDDADNWIVWGLILRSAGKYKSAKHKFEKALKLSPNNETAKQELDLVSNLMHFDNLLPTDSMLRLK